MASAVRVDLTSSAVLSRSGIDVLLEEFRRAVARKTSLPSASVTLDAVTVTQLALPTSSSTVAADVANASPVLAAPTLVNNADGSVDVTWVAVAGVIGYVVTPTAVAGTVAIGVTGDIDRLVETGTVTLNYVGLASGTSYKFKVAPIFAGKAGAYSPLSATAAVSGVPIAAPTNVGGSTVADVTWVALAGVIGYLVTCTATGGGAPTGLTGAVDRFIETGTVTIHWTGLTNGTVYKFKVLPVFASGGGRVYSPLSLGVTPA